MSPLQLAGGPELLVVLLVGLVLFGLPTLLVGLAAVWLYRRDTRRRDRIDELESELDALESRIDADRTAEGDTLSGDSRDSDGPGAGPSDGDPPDGEASGSGGRDGE